MFRGLDWNTLGRLNWGLPQKEWHTTLPVRRESRYCTAVDCEHTAETCRLVCTSSWPFPSAVACERPKFVPFTRLLPSMSWTCCTCYSWAPLNQRSDPINHTQQSRGQDFSWDLTPEQKLMLRCSGLKGFSHQPSSLSYIALLHPYTPCTRYTPYTRILDLFLRCHLWPNLPNKCSNKSSLLPSAVVLRWKSAGPQSSAACKDGNALYVVNVTSCH